MISRRTVIGGGAGATAMGLAAAAEGAKAVIIEVRAEPRASEGELLAAGRSFPCAVGRSGIFARKFEGDGSTPAGRFPLREVRYRPDRIGRPRSGLPVFETSPSDGWCDDPADPAYNRIVRLPHQTDAETMWREDHLYDLLAVIGYNDAPPVPGRGSAVFLHLAREEAGRLLPTIGCVSMRLPDLLTVLAACGPDSSIDIRTG
jgi:L,D-peptidoglycan transpeptidase YkuD (ErfK/YbiS/YcfS/YnhG family)